MLSPVESPHLISANSDLSDDLLADLPELTAAEHDAVVKAAIRMARIDKANKQASAAYYQRLNAEPYRPTATELFNWLLAESANPKSPRYIGPHGLIVYPEWGKEWPVKEAQISWEAALVQLKTIFWALCLYFTDDPAFDKLPDHVAQFAGRRFSREKSLMLYGPVGCGKTELMRLFVNNPLEDYQFMRCSEVVTEYEDTREGYGGDNALRTYLGLSSITNSPWKAVTGGWCFDDLGTEPIPGYHFKKSRNVMQWIIEESYGGRGRQPRRHITTNLSADTIQDEYGQRVRNRLRETHNVFRFDPNTPSWRDLK